MNPATPPPPPSSPCAPRLSPRRRRLRWTAALLATATLLGAGTWIAWHWVTRPALYRPDEASADITSSLARGVPAEAPRPRFRDVTQTAGLGEFRSFPGSRTSQLPEDMGAGVAWGDFDNDGDDDLFLVSAGGPLNVPTSQLARSELYRNLGGTFRRVEGFPELRLRGMGAAWGDYDGDGFLDLAVSGYQSLALFRNQGGTGQFVRDARFPDRNGFWAGVSWGDYDNDRDLDLYVCGYVSYVESETDQVRASSQLGTSVPYTLNPSSYPAAANLLLQNQSDGTFVDVAESLGVTNPTGRSLGALWHDFDDDGWLDLYVANDIAGSVFYHNRGGRFEDLSEAAWVADYRSAMGLAAGDYQRDGDDDLFVSHWVAQENALFDNLWADFNANPTRTSSPPPGTNSAPAAAGSTSSTAKPYPLRFMDLNEARGLGQVALPYVGWGAEFVDFDGDGWLDLIVANGNTLEAEGPVPKQLKPQELFLFWNQRGEFFHNLAPLSPLLSQPHHNRGLAVSDFDDDGAMDVALIQLGEGVQLLRNDMQTGHWLKVRLRSRIPSGSLLGFGDGAKVIAHVGGAALRRTVSSVSYLSQSSRVLHFGLGSARQVDRLEVRWLGGQTNLFTQLSADATWEITEGDPVPRRVAPSSTRAPGPGPSTPAALAASQPGGSSVNADPKARLREFWKCQRAAMDALKIDRNIPEAVRLFRRALELNPEHEDSRYYLGNSLAMQGDFEGALAQLQALTRINPQSHRGHSQWGILRALSATSHEELAAAEASLETAHRLNPEETGALLILGEISLLRGDLERADFRLANACRSNPKAVGGFFLRGYLAWRAGRTDAATELLKATREALGKDWQPRGTTAEGDVKQRWHVEKTPLSQFWDAWDGALDPALAFASLDAHAQGRWLAATGKRRP